MKKQVLTKRSKALKKPTKVKSKGSSFKSSVNGKKDRAPKKKNKYEFLFNQAQDAIMITDFKGNFKDVNPGLCKMFGYSRNELLTMNINALIEPEELKKRPIDFGPLYHGEHIFSGRTMMHKSGALIQVEANIKKIDANQILAIARDVTDKQKAELLIQESEAHLRSIFNITDTGYILFDSNLKILTLNAIAIERSKILFNAIMRPGDSFIDFLPTHRREISDSFLKSALKGNPVSYEIDYRLPDNAVMWLYIKLYPIQNAEKEILGVCLSTEDITEKKRAELLIQESEAHLRSIFDITDTSYVLLDTNLKILTLNAKATERAGLFFNKPMRAGDYFADFLSTERKEATLFHLKEVLNGNVKEYEVNYPLPDKSAKWYHAKLYPIRAENGTILGVCMRFTDITETKRAEIELRQAYDRLKGHINNTPLAVIEWDKDIKVTQWSPHAEKVFGWKAEEAIGKKMNEKILYEEDRERVYKYIDELNRGEQGRTPNENRNITKDGKVIYCEWYNSLLRGSDGNITTILSLVNDITEKKAIETDLKEAELKFRGLVEKSLVGVYIIQNGRFSYANPMLAEILGYSVEELIDKVSLNVVIHKEDLPMVFENIRARLDGELDSSRYELRGQRKNGELIWAEVFGSPTLYNGKSAIIGTLIDITERKKAEDELRYKNERLRELSAHLQEVREDERKSIAREIHDELGQLLTGIKMDASWLGKKLDSSQEELSERVEEMLELTDRTIQSVRRIATELRPGILDDLGLEEAIHWQATELQNKTGISSIVEGKLSGNKYSPQLSITAFRILQESLTNVIRHSNAKNVSIRLEENETHLLIEISDDGKGLAPDKQEKIKSLGIMGMKERASMMGGSLVISSAPLKGTTVKLYLPVSINL